MLGQPVLIESGGGQAGVLTDYVLDPARGQIGAWQVGQGRHKRYLVPHDIRFVLDDGVVISNREVLTEAGDLSRLRDAIKHPIRLQKLRAVTENSAKLGRVGDVLLDTMSWQIVRLQVRPPWWRRLAIAELNVGRDQIIRIERRRVVVRYDTKAPILDEVPTQEPAA